MNLSLKACDMNSTVLCAFAYFILTTILADAWSPLHFTDETQRGRVTCPKPPACLCLGGSPAQYLFSHCALVNIELA